MTKMMLLSEIQIARISQVFALSRGVLRVIDRRVISDSIFAMATAQGRATFRQATGTP